MRLPDGDPPTRAVERGSERARWIGRCANEAADCLLAHDAEQAVPALAALAERHARALDVAPREIVAAAARARERLLDFARSMGLDVARGTAARRLFPDQATLSDAAADTVVMDGPPRDPAQVAEVLTAGIADITHSLASGEFKLNEVLRMVLETMHRALGLQRVVFCLRDPKTDTLTARLALGAGGMAACKPFVIALREPPGAPVDLFAAVCRKGADTVISDTTRGGMASRLPAWYLQGVNAPSFLLLPLMMRHAPFGLIYADAATPGALAPQEKELALLRALRNQVVMAFRQAGG
jgi:hypothetical protein